MNTTTQRQTALQQWLNQTLTPKNPQQPITLTPLQNDASFRRYFRTNNTHKPMIAMDAPPEKENSQPFIDIAKLLNTHNLQAPNIIAQNLAQGFLCLSDLGNKTFANALNNQDEPNQLYQQAIDALIKMQQIPQQKLNNIPLYNEQLLRQELEYFPTWFIEKHLNMTLTNTQSNQLAELFNQLIESALTQPQAFVHRDYHSRNLMCLDQQNFTQPLGILDFQDAVVGPITYDLVSLLKDAYVDWPTAQIENWIAYYFDQATDKSILNTQTTNLETLTRWFDWMGLQRHLKILGIFARLYHRDHKPQYLQYFPRLYQYINTVCDQYPTFAALKSLMAEVQQRTTEQQPKVITE